VAIAICTLEHAVHQAFMAPKIALWKLDVSTRAGYSDDSFISCRFVSSYTGQSKIEDIAKLLKGPVGEQVRLLVERQVTAHDTSSAYQNTTSHRSFSSNVTSSSVHGRKVNMVVSIKRIQR